MSRENEKFSAMHKIPVRVRRQLCKIYKLCGVVFSVRNGRCAQTCGGNAAAHTQRSCVVGRWAKGGFPYFGLVVKL